MAKLLVTSKFHVDDETLQSLDEIASNHDLPVKDTMERAVLYESDDIFQNHPKLEKLVESMKCEVEEFPNWEDYSVDVAPDENVIRLRIELPDGGLLAHIRGDS